MQDICSLIKHLKEDKTIRFKKGQNLLSSLSVDSFVLSILQHFGAKLIFVSEERARAPPPNSRTIHTLTRPTAQDFHAFSACLHRKNVANVLNTLSVLLANYDAATLTSTKISKHIIALF